MTNTRIVLTGGGTAGHVTPNLALTDILTAHDWEIYYIGSKNGVERDLITASSIPYYKIRCGKLRRYFSWQNFLDPINLILGIIQAYNLLRKLKINIIFSKGGFVSLPVVIAGYLRKVPVVIHESDMTPGLANKLSFPFASKICLNFAETQKYMQNLRKVSVTGTPIRQFLYAGTQAKGLALCGFNSKKPCLLVIGGSQGSVIINQAVRDSLVDLTQDFQIIHICGKNNLAKDLENYPSYYQIEYANTEIADLFAASSLVISRSGANSLCELLALKKPHILIPLSNKSSRGDQIHNANYFAKNGISIVLAEEDLCANNLLKAIKDCQNNANSAIEKMQNLNIASASNQIFEILANLVDR